LAWGVQGREIVWPVLIKAAPLDDTDGIAEIASGSAENEPPHYRCISVHSGAFRCIPAHFGAFRCLLRHRKRRISRIEGWTPEGVWEPETCSGNLKPALSRLAGAPATPCGYFVSPHLPVASTWVTKNDHKWPGHFQRRPCGFALGTAVLLVFWVIWRVPGTYPHGRRWK